MEQFKPSIEAVREANRIYNEVILTLTLNPKAIVQAYRLLTDCKDVLINQQYAHKFVHSFFYHKRQFNYYPDYSLEDDIEIEELQPQTETNEPTKEDVLNVLDFAFELPEDEVDEMENDEELILINRIAELEKELELALTSDDWKLIKNTRMKITKAKNKLNQ